MPNYYHIRGAIKGSEEYNEMPYEGPLFDEFVVTAESEEAALEKHETHCEELGIEVEDLSVEVLNEYLDGGENMFAVEDTIWQPGDSTSEAQRDQQVGLLDPISVGVLITIAKMNRDNDTPVSMDRIVEEYESDRDHRLDPAKVPNLFENLIDGNFVKSGREDGTGVYSITPERIREIRRHTLKKAHLGEWASRNLTDN